MRTFSAALLALLLLPLLPVANASGAAASVTAVSATGPDAEGAWDLAFDVTVPTATRATLTLDVMRDGTPGGARDLAARDLAAGTTRIATSFLPDAPGNHDVRLLVNGVWNDAALHFTVRDGAGATARMTFDVVDEPTYVNLTSDAVNADGKVKSPGETLTTRFTISDGNGLAELDAPTWRVEGPGGFSDAAAFDWNPNGTSASIEHRYARSPLAAGSFKLNIVATKRGAAVANATRTFVIRDVATTLDASTPPLTNVTPDVDVAQTLDVVLADKNGAPLAVPAEARVYRGSARVESSGFAAALDAPRALPDAGDGNGRAAYPMRLTVPALAAPGAYRVSIYANGTLAGALPFNVSSLPTLTNVTSTSTQDRLQLDVTGSGDGLVTTLLTDHDGSTLTTTRAFTNGTATISIDAPSASGSYAWNVTLRAREGGPALASRTGNWTRAEPALVLTSTHGGPRAFAWNIAAPDWELSGANASVTIARWDGAVESAFAVTYDANANSLRFDAPATLAPGRYQADLTLRLANGSVGRATWSFEAGPWMRVTLGNVTVTGREARISVVNDGGVTFRRLVVEADGLDEILLANGTRPAAGANGRLSFASLDVAPGSGATLVARLADGPQASGAHAAKLRVFALAGSG